MNSSEMSELGRRWCRATGLGRLGAPDTGAHGPSGLGAWFPFAAPGLWAAATGTTAGTVAPVSGLQLVLVAPVGLLVIAVTLAMWRRLELDR